MKWIEHPLICCKWRWTIMCFYLIRNWIFKIVKKVGTLYGYNGIIQKSDYSICLSRMLVSLFEGNISVKLAVAWIHWSKLPWSFSTQGVTSGQLVMEIFVMYVHSVWHPPKWPNFFKLNLPLVSFGSFSSNK